MVRRHEPERHDANTQRCRLSFGRKTDTRQQINVCLHAVLSCELTAPCFSLPSSQNTRIKEGIININPDEEPLRSELLSGKFTVLVSAEANADYRFIITPHDRQSIMLMMLVKEECVYLQGSLHMYACICLVYNTYKHVYVHTNLIICSCSFQPGRDAKGAALALFTARLHRPDVTTHKAVLQAIIYQLDKAIER